MTLSAVSLTFYDQMLEVKFRIAMKKADFNKKMALFARKLDLNVRTQLVQCYILYTA
jgi:hypothetical protein